MLVVHFSHHCLQLFHSVAHTLLDGGDLVAEQVADSGWLRRVVIRHFRVLIGPVLGLASALVCSATVVSYVVVAELREVWIPCLAIRPVSSHVRIVRGPVPGVLAGIVVGEESVEGRLLSTRELADGSLLHQRRTTSRAGRFIVPAFGWSGDARCPRAR